MAVAQNVIPVHQSIDRPLLQMWYPTNIVNPFPSGFNLMRPPGPQGQMNPALNWMHGKEKRKKEFNIVEQIFRTRA